MKSQPQSLLGADAGKVVKSNNQAVICERQGKLYYRSEKPELIVQAFKANSTDNGKKRAGKTRTLESLRNDISSYLFEYLEGFHIPTHFVRKVSPTEMMVKWVDVIPLTVRVYNVGSNGMLRRLGLRDGTTLEFPVIEHYYQNGVRDASWVNEFHVYALAIATPDEFKQINRIASKVNAVLRGLCDRRQLMLAELQLEFGRYKGQVVLTDEISPFTCHFVDTATNDLAKRDRFLVGQENAEEAFAELCDRLMLKV